MSKYEGSDNLFRYVLHKECQILRKFYYEQKEKYSGVYWCWCQRR